VAASSSVDQLLPNLERRAELDVMVYRGLSDGALVRAHIEEALADGEPFGDSGYILGRVRLHYEHRLEIVAEHTPAAAALLSALRTADPNHSCRVIADPVVRTVIDDAVRHFRLDGPVFPENELNTVLTFAKRNLEESKNVPPLAEGEVRDICCIRNRNVCPWIWSGHRSDNDVLGQIFGRTFEKYHGDLELRAVNESSQQMLLAGMALLQNLLPRLSRSALDHVQVISIIGPDSASRHYTSFTDPRMPGAMFLSPSVLGNPWKVAEHLLHEALHLKFIDIEHTHSLLASDFDPANSPTIRPHWNRSHPLSVNEWPINRVLTVMHVYTSLALFFATIANDRSLLDQVGGVLNPIKEGRRALDRARYLGEQLEQSISQLGFAGRCFVRWLRQMLDAIDPSPPLRDSYVHLLLDLYDREVEEIQRLSQRIGKKENVAEAQRVTCARLAEMSRNELECTDQVLAIVEENPFLAARVRSNQNLHIASEEDGSSLDAAVLRFVSIRGSVSEILSGVPAEYYLKLRLANDHVSTAGEIVQGMVERSGQCLNELFDLR
jgi:hypothetical protein